MDIKVKGRSPSPTELPPPGERRGTVIVDPGIVNSPLPVYVDGYVLKAMKKYARSGGVLGWYHSHPAYGVFLSEYDMFIQRGFFSEEHMCAVVVDPFQQPRDQVGVFTWKDGDVSNGYHLIVYTKE